MKLITRLSSVALVAASMSPLFAQSLTTTYAGGNSGTTTWTNQFDLTVLHPGGVTLTALDVNCENTRSGGVGSPFTITVWVIPGGTYVGNQTNSAPWINLSQGAGVSGPQGTPTDVDIADFALPPGTHAIALEYNGTAMAYTNGTGANQMYANADIQVDLGSSTTGLFGAPVYDPRVWNGTIHYFVGNATARTFGTGCLGSNGTPALAPQAGSLPSFGSNYVLEATNLPMPSMPVFLLIGFSRTTWSGLPLPFDFAILGAPDCFLRTSVLANLPHAGVNGMATFTIPMTTDPALSGVALYSQMLNFDAAANPFGLTMSNAVEGYIGL